MKREKDYYWVMIIIMIVLLGGVTCCHAAAATPTTPQVHASIELRDTTKTQDEVIGTIDVKVNGKVSTYKLYKGKRGGYYYLPGGVDKNGRPKRRYLTKKEKEQNGLK